MLENAQNTLPVITGALLVLALLLFLLSLRLFRRSRSDVFWRRRRDAGQRGWRILVLSFLLIILSIFSCIFTAVSTLINRNNSTPAPTEVVIEPSPSPLPNATLEATQTLPVPNSTEVPVPTPTPTVPVDTPTPVVIVITATPVYTPTETPFPTYTPVVTPLVSDVTPLPDAMIRIMALDDQISDALTPVNPRAAFRAGTTRIYMFVEFTGMAQGVLWRRELYRDGQKIDGNSYLWGLETDGTGYFFFGDDSGFPPGNYEIRLYIGSNPDPENIASFTIVDVP
jgi:hypothetical protein